MGQEIAVYPARLSRWLSLFVAIGLIAYCIYALMRPMSAYYCIVTSIMLVIALPSAIFSIYSIRRPRHLATFTSEGIIDAFGNLWVWQDIKDIGNDWGSFRIRTLPPNKVEIRLDPAIVGWTRIADVKAFLRQHAPPDLTTRL